MRASGNIRLLVLRLWCLAALVLGAGLAMIQPALAQTANPQMGSAQAASPPASSDKVDQLIKLLDDPEIRALLNRQTAAPVADTDTNMSATEFNAFGDRVRDHLRHIGQAIPLVPSEFMRAGRNHR